MYGFPDGDLDHAVGIGAIDDRSVRVWVRFSGQTHVFARLETSGHPLVVAAISRTLSTDRTIDRSNRASHIFTSHGMHADASGRTG